MSSRSSTEEARTTATFGCCLLNLVLGGWLFDYCLWNIFNKDIPWYGDALAGVFTGQFALPCAVGLFVLKLCGVNMPLIKKKMG